MLKRVPTCLRFSFFLGVSQVLLGSYLVIKELYLGTYVPPESMGTLFLAIGIGLLARTYVKSLDRTQCASNCK